MNRYELWPGANSIGIRSLALVPGSDELLSIPSI
jgi:hypothetical protein